MRRFRIIAILAWRFVVSADETGFLFECDIVMPIKRPVFRFIPFFCFTFGCNKLKVFEIFLNTGQGGLWCYAEFCHSLFAA
jgi:hypothetical protein